ncbi:protein FAM151A [Odontesthes bonariensis]|uniref:protein FAM151A n=1 Tax=Odontesthes bonariensis TaxID=219752 RepID=UPI003F580613
MLDFLVQSSYISKPDGLLATWFHRANSKEEMDKALASGVMILEADVTLEGYGTQNQKPIPIMAHPPNIYSDNTLDQWLDAVLNTRKAMKLDFKSLASVGLSLDLLRQKNSSRGINRPVWLNADILQGPNVPNFVPAINATRFLQLIQEKFPDVTLSPGWQVLYAPPIFNATYSRAMVKDMYDIIKDVPQKVTFPVHALLVRSGWQHINWLLSQSPRFSLTLWQGSVHPNISDLLFVRDNTHPTRVYYDIYEPTLSEFKQAASEQNHFRRFYPGGSLMDFFYPSHNSDTAFMPNSLAVHWFTITEQASLLTHLSGEDGGMLIINVASDSNLPGVPVVESSGRNSEPLTLQHVLHLLGWNAHARWGVYLRVHMNQLLEASLKLLHSAYTAGKLYRPVWISLEDLQSSNNSSDFVSITERLFPYVTLVLAGPKWPPLIPAVVTDLSQKVALHLTTASLLQEQEELYSLMEMDRYDFLVELDRNDRPETFTFLKELMAQRTKSTNTNLYMISDQL